MSTLKSESLRDAYGDVLVELGEQDPRIVVLTADLAESTRTLPFGERFPDRFFNIGVAEANMMGIAAGLAMNGLRPFVSTFAMFAAGKPWEQIRQVIAYQDAPVRIFATHAGLTVGEDGASHQMLEDINNMRVLPGMKVIVPADAVETRQVTRWAAEHDDGPVYVRLSRAKFPTIFNEDDYSFELGKARIVRDGSDVTLLACGLMVANSLAAADALAHQGISARVVNVSSIEPLDVETIVQCARETGRVVTVEEHQIKGGLGSAVCEALSEHQPTPVLRLGVRGQWGQSGEAFALIEHYGLAPAGIAAAVGDFLRGERQP
ncbi:MAG TPA: transketolase family protein [Sphingobacteriaceae bacterium]|nr:transketolase family protein [Sphingobacteriaceae bacterium]